MSKNEDNPKEKGDRPAETKPSSSDAVKQDAVISGRLVQTVHEQAFQSAHQNDRNLSDPAMIAMKPGETLEDYSKRLKSASENRFELVDDSDKSSDGRQFVDYKPVQQDKKTFELGTVLIERPADHGDILSVTQRIAALPLQQQFEVIGTGLMAGMQQYSNDERQRNFGRVIGTVEGTGQVLQNLAKVADFGAALILGDNERAGKAGAEFGTAVGETIVGGVRLFQTADKYLFDIGFSGDYSKPFKDVVSLGQTLNEQWAQKSPFEQERVKAKLITELIGDGAIGGAGVSAIRKAGKFTEILDTVATETKELYAVSKHATKRAVNAIGSAVDDLVAPMGDTGYGGMRMPIPKSNIQEDTTLAMKRLEGQSDSKTIKARGHEMEPDRAPKAFSASEVEQLFNKIDLERAQNWSQKLKVLSERPDFPERKELIDSLLREKLQHPKGVVNMDVALHELALSDLRHYRDAIDFVHYGRKLPGMTPKKIEQLQKDAEKRLDKLVIAVQQQPQEMEREMKSVRAVNDSIDLIAPRSEVLLAKGIHEKSFEEVERLFKTNERRREIFKGFMSWAREMKEAGCETIYLDGSFVTAKPNPGDFDACWEAFGTKTLPPNSKLLDASNEANDWRKAKFGGDIFPRFGDYGDRVEKWQFNLRTNEDKGIIKLDLRTLK